MCVCVCVYTHIYIYVCVCVCVCVYTHIYTCISRFLPTSFQQLLTRFIFKELSCLQNKFSPLFQIKPNYLVNSFHNKTW